LLFPYPHKINYDIPLLNKNKAVIYKHLSFIPKYIQFPPSLSNCFPISNQQLNLCPVSVTCLLSWSTIITENIIISSTFRNISFNLSKIICVSIYHPRPKIFFSSIPIETKRTQNSTEILLHISFRQKNSESNLSKKQHLQIHLKCSLSLSLYLSFYLLIPGMISEMDCHLQPPPSPLHCRYTHTPHSTFYFYLFLSIHSTHFHLNNSWS
jgi:hypothetical protein